MRGQGPCVQARPLARSCGGSCSWRAPEQFGHFVMVGRTRDSLARNVIDVMQNEQLFGKLADEVSYRTGQPFAMIMGRKVWVLGASDSQAEKTLRGLTVAGAYVDEVTVVREDLFKQLLARMSVEDAKMFCTTNPDSPMHWFKVEYLDRIGPGRVNFRTGSTGTSCSMTTRNFPRRTRTRSRLSTPACGTAASFWGSGCRPRARSSTCGTLLSTSYRGASCRRCVS